MSQSNLDKILAEPPRQPLGVQPSAPDSYCVDIQKPDSNGFEWRGEWLLRTDGRLVIIGLSEMLLIGILDLLLNSPPVPPAFAATILFPILVTIGSPCAWPA
jgi:hypothetical protein